MQKRSLSLALGARVCQDTGGATTTFVFATSVARLALAAAGVLLPHGHLAIGVADSGRYGRGRGRGPAADQNGGVAASQTVGRRALARGLAVVQVNSGGGRSAAHRLAIAFHGDSGRLGRTLKRPPQHTRAYIFL